MRERSEEGVTEGEEVGEEHCGGERERERDRARAEGRRGGQRRVQGCGEVMRGGERETGAGLVDTWIGLVFNMQDQRPRNRARRRMADSENSPGACA